jgi:hypothetical protein
MKAFRHTCSSKASLLKAWRPGGRLSHYRGNCFYMCLCREHIKNQWAQRAQIYKHFFTHSTKASLLKSSTLGVGWGTIWGNRLILHPYTVYILVPCVKEHQIVSRSWPCGLVSSPLRTYDTFPTFSLEIFFQPPPLEEFLEINFEFPMVSILHWNVCLFVYSRLSNFSAITGDRAANLGLCSALWAFEQGWIFIVPHLLRHGTSVYTVSSERPAPTSHCGIRSPDSRIIRSLSPTL